MEKEEKTYKKESYIESDNRAILGAVNGTVIFNLVYPLLIICFLQLIFRNNYESVINDNYELINLSINLASTILAIIASVFIVKPRKLLQSFQKIDSKQVKTMFAILGLMLAFTMMYNTFVLMVKPDVGSGNENQETVESFIRSLPFLSFLSFVLVGPVLEEITYRYCIFGGIKKHNRIIALIVSGLIFMLAHAMAGLTDPSADIVNELILLPPYFVSGFLLAYAYDKTDNLLVPLSIHVLNNLLSFVITLI